MMKQHFQFCFCKNFEDNKIPYQKLLMLLQSCHCHFISLLSLDIKLTVSSSSSQSRFDLAPSNHNLKCMQSLLFAPCFSQTPLPFYDDNQSIHSTISLENRLSSTYLHCCSGAFGPGRRSTFSDSQILDLLYPHGRNWEEGCGAPAGVGQVGVWFCCLQCGSAKLDLCRLFRVRVLVRLG